ncbi:MAG: hypothetical protein HY364_02295 [Candidatus Aenigmarchaeota archaeon]|nr:hypothetical protein [Candidatus Aenigmarchaeota archaeon]
MKLGPMRKKKQTYPSNMKNPWNTDLTPYVGTEIIVYQHAIIPGDHGHEERHTREQGYLLQIYPHDSSFDLGRDSNMGSSKHRVHRNWDGGGVNITTYRITTADLPEKEVYASDQDFSRLNLIDKASFRQNAQTTIKIRKGMISQEA